jgi:hypothetical protein
MMRGICIRRCFPGLAAACVAAAAAGCVSFTHFGGMEPSVRPMKPLPYDVIGEAESSTGNFNLLWFFNVTAPANFDRAVSDAINQRGGDELIDVRWWLERQHWILGTVNVIYIKGKVVKYREEE